MDYVYSFISLVDGVKLATILVLFLVDFLMGIVVAVKEGTFQLSKVANFLNTSVLYYFGGYLLLGIAATVEPNLGEALVTGAWVLLDATMIGAILAKGKKLGLPVPDKMT